MNLERYKEMIKATAQYPTEVEDFSLAYLTLGFLGEMGEAEEKGFADDKENGDVMWYMVGLCNKLELHFDTLLLHTFTSTFDVEPRYSKIAERTKKYYRDGKDYDLDLIKGIFCTVIARMFRNVDECLKALEINYNKLTKRLEDGTIKGEGSER